MQELKDRGGKSMRNIFALIKLKLKRVLPIFFILILFSTFLPVSADEIPYTTYSYWNNVGSEPVEVQTKPIYEVEDIITSSSLNIDEFQSIDDICADENGDLYILDGKNSKIIIINSNYTVKKNITEINTGSEVWNFKDARGIFVKNNIIYICDTSNSRVLAVDHGGNLIKQFLVPDSPIIPSDFIYSPIKLTVDNYGYTYILCDGSYYGALLFDENDDFVGFYGANSVETGVLGAISNAFRRVFANTKKKSATATVLPFAFNDICADSDGFIYTSTGFTTSNQKGQIKKLGPGTGNNILNSNSVNFVDSKVNQSFKVNSTLYQNVVALDIYNDYVYMLDSTYGRVFIYDQDCNLLSAFGGGLQSGNQKGTFVNATSLCVVNSNIYICDSTKNTITIFKRTEYGKVLMDAQSLTLLGEYDKAEVLWEKVISQDRNCQLAYSGLALAKLEKGDHSSALKYAKQGYDRETYSLAFRELRTEWLGKNFAYIAIFSIVFLLSVIVFILLNKKKKYISIKNENIKLLFSVNIHPFNSFYKIQEKKLGSWKICFVMTVVFFFVYIAESLYGGFAFTTYDVNTYNSFLVFLRSSGLIVLYIIVNWLVSTLFSGRGRIKDIACVACYSLTPMIVGDILSIILTNILIPSEGAFISILKGVSLLFTLLLIVIGTIVVHDFDFKHFVGTMVLTIIGMAIVVFLLIMIWLLIQQLAFFLITIYKEFTM